MTSDDTGIQKMASDDIGMQKITSGGTKTLKITSDDTNIQTMTLDSTATQQMALDDTGIQKNVSDDTKAQMASDYSDMQKIASDGVEMQKLISADTNMPKITSDDICKQKKIPHDTDVEKKPSTSDMRKMFSTQTIEKKMIRSDDTGLKNNIEADIGTDNADMNMISTELSDTRNQTLSLDEHKRLKDQRIQQFKQNTRQHIFDEISAFYSDPKGPYKYHSKLAKNCADEWLDPDFMISWDDGCSDDEDAEFTSVGSRLEHLRKQWLTTEKEQILMLRFPLPEHMVPHSQVPLTLDQDDKSLHLQNEEFLKQYDSNTRLTVYHDRIECLNLLRHHINQFLWQQCSNTYLATIVFNGHGYCIRTADNSHHGTLSIYRSGNVPCDEIINIVQASLDRLQENINPQAVDVIFVQCYGHLHSHIEQPERRIKIVPLISNRDPNTHTSAKTGDFEVIMAYHTLDQLAEVRSDDTNMPKLESADTNMPKMTSNNTYKQKMLNDTDVENKLCAIDMQMSANETVEQKLRSDDTGLHNTVEAEITIDNVNTSTMTTVPENISIQSLDSGSRPPVLKPQGWWTRPTWYNYFTAAATTVTANGRVSILGFNALFFILQEALHALYTCTIGLLALNVVPYPLRVVFYALCTDTESDDSNTGSEDTDKERLPDGIDTETNAAIQGDTHIPTLSLATFQKLKDERVKELEQNTKKHFTDEISAFYSDKKGPYKYDDNLAERSAEEWFDPFTSIDNNDDGGNDKNNPDAPAKRLKNQWLATKNETVLMLRFPLPDSKLKQRIRGATEPTTVTLTLDQDDESRLKQNEGFKKLYYKTTENKPTVFHERIEHLNQLRPRIDQFLHNECSETCLATIVLNGHGSHTQSTDGTHHGTLTIHRSGNVANNEIINIVQELRQNITDINPQEVDVIFAQCFGHLYSLTDQTESRINIISLTSEGKPKSRTSIKLNGQEVEVACHSCLEQCGYDRLEEALRKPADEDSSNEPLPNTSVKRLQTKTFEKVGTQEIQPSTAVDVVCNPINDVLRSTGTQPQPILRTDTAASGLQQSTRTPIPGISNTLDGQILPDDGAAHNLPQSASTPTSVAENRTSCLEQSLQFMVWHNS